MHTCHHTPAVRTDAEITCIARRERARQIAQRAADAALIVAFIFAVVLLAPYVRAHVTSSPAFAELVAAATRA